MVAVQICTTDKTCKIWFIKMLKLPKVWCVSFLPALVLFEQKWFTVEVWFGSWNIINLAKSRNLSKHFFTQMNIKLMLSMLLWVSQSRKETNCYMLPHGII